jgi:cytochrome P450
MSFQFPGLPAHVPWGHFTALRRDPLGFLAQCAQGDETIVPLRLPIVRVFLLLDPVDIEQVLVTQQRNFVKPLWLRTPAVRRLLGDGLVTSDGDPWRRQRRACQPAFHPSRLPNYAVAMGILAERAMDDWQEGQERDILHDMARLTLEIVIKTLLGTEGAAQAGPISGAMDTLMHSFSAPASLLGLMPRLPGLREAHAARRLDQLVDGLVRDGQAAGNGAVCGEEETPTLLADLLRFCPGPPLTARNEGARGRTQDPRAPRQVREQVKTFLTAGHESSALALTWACLLLASHPDIDARLGAELTGVLGNNNPRSEDLPRLPYLQAVVRETLRLYPPLWMTGRRALEQCEIAGHQIPAGAVLLTSPWAVQRRPHLFPDPEAFRPERWLDLPEVLPRFSYFPFGGGPRGCIGQGFALMEMGLILATITRRFRLELTSTLPVRPWATMTLRPPVGVRLRLIARETGDANRELFSERQLGRSCPIL